MKSYILLTFIGVLFTSLLVNAQNTSYDSLLLDQKFERLKFQIDSLSKVVTSQANTINKISQTPISDSLQKKILKSEREIMIVRHNLYKMHKQNQVANGLTIAGVSFVAIGFVLLTQSDYGAIHTAGIVLSLGGSFMATVIGPILRADSNRFLGGAGKKYRIVKE